MAVSPIPAGFHTVTPYLCVPGAGALIDFLGRALGAEELFRLARPDGAIMHAQVRIGDSVVMLGEPMEPRDARPAMFYLYVPDADALYARAIAAGAESVREPVTTFYGDRSGGVRDPAGNLWWIATHVEDISPEEVARRAAAGQHG